ncbi:MAG TPA: PilZ domain-containing protein [Thermodesulfobacteriota bacterium]|nr:PilZ domain-containing protein [Thermodesulfobacteriota bacterium]
MELRVCPECNKAFYARRAGEVVACPHCGFVLYDRRRKKRVLRELAFYFSMEGRVVQATLRDYSKDGLRIAYEGDALRPDAVIDISIDELDIHRHAQPVWSKKMSKSTVSAGLKLL